MPRIEPYLGVLLALLLLLFVVAGLSIAPQPSVPTNTASSTLSVVPSVMLPPLPFPALGEGGPAATTTELASVPKAAAPSVPKPAPAPIPTAASAASPAAAPLPAPAPAALPTSGDGSLDDAALRLRAALVNILCYVPLQSGLHSISGSGVIVSPSGIILTNAHVAQYFLLADRGARCSIRAGSPAADSYEAALVFISPAWLRANATVLTQEAPAGTGEYDFALLAVTANKTAAPLPSAFPSIPLATRPPAAGTPVVIASYGAQFLESNQIRSALFPTVVFGSVKDVYTFTEHTIDVLALGGSAAAQEGSSGGGVAGAAGTLLGTITTSTVTGDTASRSLDAVTASYIRGEYASETGEPLDLLLARDPATAAADFAPQIPVLESILTAHLP